MTAPVTSSERGSASSDFITSVARAMAVLECFTSDEGVRKGGRLTLTDAAKLTDLSRGTARRLLLTLKELHYVDTDGKVFWVTPKLINLSRGFLMPRELGKSSASILRSLTQVLNDSASVGVLDGADIVYIERLEVRRIWSSRIVNGTRLPAACTSIGRVLLASLPDQDLHRWLQVNELQQANEYTITDPQLFWEEILRVREQGYAIVDQELEVGIRSIAVPIKSPSGRTIAALNASTVTARNSTETLKRKFLPELLGAAVELSETIGW